MGLTREEKERRNDAIGRFKYVAGHGQEDLGEDLPDEVEAALKKLSSSDIEALADYVRDGDMAELDFEESA